MRTGTLLGKRKSGFVRVAGNVLSFLLLQGDIKKCDHLLSDNDYINESYIYMLTSEKE